MIQQDRPECNTSKLEIYWEGTFQHISTSNLMRTTATMDSGPLGGSDAL